MGVIDRYTRPEMGRIWSEESKYQAWLRVELAVCEPYTRRGRVPADAMARALFGPYGQRQILLDRLPALTTPTLVVWGTDSDVLSESQARRMVETLPKGELVTVPGVGHAPTLVEPAVVAALERFL